MRNWIKRKPMLFAIILGFVFLVIGTELRNATVLIAGFAFTMGMITIILITGQIEEKTR